MKKSNVIIQSDYGPIIINVFDRFIGRGIIEHGYWSSDDIEIIKNFLSWRLNARSEVVFYDVGANIGTHSLAIGKSFGSKVLVRSFEAQRAIFYMLCGSIAINNLSNVICYHAAVSDKSDSVLRFSTPDYSTENNFGGLELVEPCLSDNQDMVKLSEEEVRTLRLDDFNEEVDFIKMDVEGMEDLALKGSEKIFEKSRPVVFTEILKTDRDFVFQFFKSRNYIAFQKEMDAIFVPAEFDLSITGLSRIF
jgi:FkbM family methyltransferase